MSISFNITQTHRIACLAEWLSTSSGEALDFACAVLRQRRNLERAFALYMRGTLPLSEVRKHHRQVCDLLEDAAKHFPELDVFI